VTGYHNPAYDGLYAQQASGIDQAKRRSAVLEMQQVLLADQPVVVLYYGLAVQAFRTDRFQNWLFVPNGLLALTDQRSLTQVVPAQ
jgi:peptide/nickel transport system substrate-binding protein